MDEFETYIVYIHVLLTRSLFLSGLCQHIVAIHGTLPPPTVDQWNRVKPSAGLYIASPTRKCILVHEILTKQEHSLKNIAP